MFFHLILTDHCNLCCKYCRAKVWENLEESEGERALVISEDLPVELDFDLDILDDFLKKDPAVTLTFYGGEPLLRAELVERIVQEAPVIRFMIQTTGLLLDRLPEEIINRFTTILVSIDRRKELTDANRGTGVYERDMRNVRTIRANEYTVELIARMSVTGYDHAGSDQDCLWFPGHDCRGGRDVRCCTGEQYKPRVSQ